MLALTVLSCLVAAPAPLPRVHDVPRPLVRRLADSRQWNLHYGTTVYPVAFFPDGTYEGRVEANGPVLWRGVWAVYDGIVHIRETTTPNFNNSCPTSWSLIRARVTCQLEPADPPSRLTRP